MCLYAAQASVIKVYARNAWQSAKLVVDVEQLQVNDLVEAAAGLISVIDDLRPLDPDTFNAFYEIFKAIAAVPPADR